MKISAIFLLPGASQLLSRGGGSPLVVNRPLQNIIDKTTERPLECPAGCDVFFDGCNTCFCHDDPTVPPICGYSHCEEHQEPHCVRAKPLGMPNIQNRREVPWWCDIWFDGCNACMQPKGAQTASCTKLECPEREEPFCLQRGGGVCMDGCDSWLNQGEICDCRTSGEVWCRQVSEPMCLRS